MCEPPFVSLPACAGSKCITNFPQIEIELPFTEEELQEKYDGKLEKEMSGETYKVVSKVLKVVTGKKITEPKDFSSHYRQPVVTCSHKAASGFLYPLERGLIFVYKPPIFLRYDELRSVSFERSGGSTRSFDINAVTRNDIRYGVESHLCDHTKFAII